MMISSLGPHHGESSEELDEHLSPVWRDATAAHSEILDLLRTNRLYLSNSLDEAVDSCSQGNYFLSSASHD